MHETSKCARGLVVLAVPALLASGLVGLAAGAAEAATVREFSNCTAMHKVNAFRGGIAKPGAHDKDDIACEQ